MEAYPTDPKRQPPLDEAIRELARRRPVRLNERLAHKVGSEEKALQFEDDHTFVVAIPAWVFRAIGKAAEAPR